VPGNKPSRKAWAKHAKTAADIGNESLEYGQNTTIPAKNPSRSDVMIVAIGRNEGQRLIDCLTSLGSYLPRTVYVDSGSNDGSAQIAEDMGARVVRLDMTRPFTAARARNAGFLEASKLWPGATFVQFVDGDCALDGRWIDAAHDFLDRHNDVALVFGRRQERFPERSVYNALCDRGWNGSAGQVSECGGDIFIRAAALRDVGAYTSSLIAGEEPELCVRLRSRGWMIWRLDAEMTWHDANITTVRQWWRRTVRTGHAFAEVSALHWKSPFGIWKRSASRSVAWGGILPIAAIGGALFHPLALMLLGLYPLQIARLASRFGFTRAQSWRNAFFDVAGKFPELQGVVKFHATRLLGRRPHIIEYK
jgi:glycosyltransferase involved in cell wall biosynthesis